MATNELKLGNSSIGLLAVQWIGPLTFLARDAAEAAIRALAMADWNASSSFDDAADPAAFSAI
jgi:hypothetical protein